MLKEYIIELGLELVKGKIEDKSKLIDFRKKMDSFLSYEESKNITCTKEEEIDFEKLANYIRENLISDVEKRVIGNREERQAARRDIIAKTVAYSNANTSLATNRAQKMVADAIDIIRHFYKNNAKKEMRYIAGQIEDTIIESIEENSKDIINEIKGDIKEVNSKLEESNFLSVDSNMKTIASGDIESIEADIMKYFNAIGSQHILFPNYQYFYDSSLHGFLSKPVSEQAVKLYPPVIKCNGTIQVGGEYINKFDIATIEYANRHQLPIKLNVQVARKLLGDILDPIQREAEELMGESIVIAPKPFPLAMPCSVAINNEVYFDYITLRTEEILEDGTIVLSNSEQDGCVYKMQMKVNLEKNFTTYVINISDAKNEELLQYLRFMNAASAGGDIVIKSLSLNASLAVGKVGKFEYKSGSNSLKEELDFIEKVVIIERYFKKNIEIPTDIMHDDYEAISYLVKLINGDECKGGWKKFSLEIPVTEELKENINNEHSEPFSISYVGTISFEIFGEIFEVDAIKQFETVMYEDIEKLKKKLAVLDEGDNVNISFVPNGEGVWRDYLKK